MFTMRQAPVSRAWRAWAQLVRLSVEGRSRSSVVGCRRAWCHEVVVRQGLLDHEQLEGVELAQVFRVRQGVGRIGVDGEQDPRVPAADLADHRDVSARL